ncbi:MAG: NUDIX hydrolase N-terminal domain-containing protein, partial [Micromonosporaceae bacterium]
MSATARWGVDVAKRSEAESHGERLHKIAMEIAALAQNGLNYGTDRYEIAR